MKPLFKTGDVIERKNGRRFGGSGTSTVTIQGVSWYCSDYKTDLAGLLSVTWVDENCRLVTTNTASNKTADDNKFLPFWTVAATGQHASADKMAEVLRFKFFSEAEAINHATNMARNLGKEYTVMKTVKLIKPIQQPVEVLDI